jgi:hypothetical protein
MDFATQTPSNIFVYFAAFIILILIMLISVHIRQWKVQNTELKILQTCQSPPELVYDLIQKHLPLVYQNEMDIWKEADLLTDQTLPDIKEIIAEYPNMTNIIKNNLAINNKPFTYDWAIDIRPLITTPTDPIYIIKQRNYLQLYVCITGTCKILLIAPMNSELELKHIGAFTKYVATADITAKLDINPPEFEFIEVIVRSGNMIYIPYGWYHHIYNVTINDDAPDSNIPGECIIMDCINKSLIDIF